MGIEKVAYWGIVERNGKIECVEKNTIFQLEKYINETGSKLVEVLRGKRVPVNRVVRTTVTLQEVE